MAISPKSKGLGNIGSIVNRQGRVSPTRPAAKLAPKMPVPKPVAPARPNTTTLAQRQANQPFKNYSKPAMPRIDPMAQQPMQPMQPMIPPPQPFNPQPNPGQMPMNQNIYPYTPVPDPFMGGLYGGPDVMPPDYDPYQGMFGQQDQRQIMGNMNTGPTDVYIPGMVDNPYYGKNPFGAPTVDANGPAGQQALQTGMQGIGQMFGNPNPMTSDYDELEGSKFNTNPSNGSMFGGGGFSGY
jgi:hypothetical protein